MYSKELEEIIAAALADGVLTEKERAVLHKKAQQEGVDPDELDVVIEGRLAKMKREENRLKAESPTSVEQGTVVKCPNCGAKIPGGAAKCPECGYEFRNVKVNSVAQKFSDELSDLLTKRSMSKQAVGIFFSAMGMDNEITNFISTYPVPNTSEDLLEMLSITEEKANQTGTGEQRAYWQLYSNCIKKAKISFADDIRFEPYFKNYRKSGSKRKTITLVFVSAIFLLIIFIGSWVLGLGGYLEPSSDSDYNSSKENMTKEISDDKSTSNIQDKIDAQYDKLSEEIKSFPEPTVENYKELKSKLKKMTWDPITTEAETAKKAFKSPSDDEKYERVKKEAFYEMVRSEASTLNTFYSENIDESNGDDPELESLKENGYE